MLSIPGSLLQLSSAGFICTNFFYFIRQFYLHFTYWINRLSLFSTSKKCSNHRLSLLSLLLRILPVLQHSALVFLFVQGFHVLLFSRISSFFCNLYFLLSTLTCLLTSLSFCRYSFCHLCFGLSDLAPISFCLIWFSFGLPKPKPPD